MIISVGLSPAKYPGFLLTRHASVGKSVLNLRSQLLQVIQYFSDIVDDANESIFIIHKTHVTHSPITKVRRDEREKKEQTILISLPNANE
jgi:hypothetical protein